MKRQELDAEFKRLEHQIKEIRENTENIPGGLLSLCCQTVCVSICGSLEYCLKNILIEYTKRNSRVKIHRPINRLCQNYQNPKPNTILDLLELFDSEFKFKLIEYWKSNDEIEKKHLEYLVDDRHTIAHRRTLHVNVTLVKLENYFKAYKRLLERIYERFLG